MVSLIIPCRNEKKIIVKCLDSIINQNFPKENFEILLIDGKSQDGTKEILNEYTNRYPNIKVLDNPNMTTPFAMNIGIKESKGDVIMKIDAHTVYDKEYIKNCLWYMQKFGADNVGGILKTVPAKSTLTAKAIAFCLSSIFGAGNSYFRTGTAEPKWQDTVAFGCYKKEVFEKIGLYNEKLKRSQDMELNLRLKKNGLKTLLFPKIAGYYYPKDNFKDFFMHNFNDGIWAIYPLKFVKISFNVRHYIPLLFVLSLIISLFLSIFLKIFFYIFLAIFISYALLAIYFSFNFVREEKKLSALIILFFVFFIRHFGYGFGSIVGIIKLLK